MIQNCEWEFSLACEKKASLPPSIMLGGMGVRIGILPEHRGQKLSKSPVKASVLDVVKAFENIIGSKIIVDKNSHLMGAFGIALMARELKEEKIFNFDINL